MDEKEIKAYRDGFIDGQDMKDNYRYQMFGYDISKLLDIIGEYKLKEKPEEKPAFEIRGRQGQHYKIYANGKIEGFADGSVVVNRIPELITKVIPSSTKPTVHFDEWPFKLQTDPAKGLQVFVYGKLVYQHNK